MSSPPVGKPTLAEKPRGAPAIDATMSGIIGTGEKPRLGEQHAICMVCDFFYPRMGVRFVFVYIQYMA